MMTRNIFDRKSSAFSLTTDKLTKTDRTKDALIIRSRIRLTEISVVGPPYNKPTIM